MRSSKIVLDGESRSTADSSGTSRRPTARTRKLIAQMKGKKMPQVGRVEISIMEEDQSRLLAFQNGELDIMNMEGPLAPNVLDGGKLRPELAQKGVQLSRIVDPEISLPRTGTCRIRSSAASTKEKIALRRAMAMAYPVDEEIKVVRNGQAVEAQLPDPAGRRRPRSATGRAVDQLRSRRRERAARQVRLQEGRRRLSHAARRQAARRSATRRGRTRCGAPARRARRRSRSTRSASGWSAARTSSPSS